jgi:hypothetical protein
MTISLQQLRLASPCDMSWHNMPGDSRARYCERCSLHVYNIESLTETEVQRLIMENEGRFCGRLWIRKDGTIVTRDCPVGLAMLRRAWWWTIGRAAGLLMLLSGGLVWAINSVNAHRATQPITRVKPIETMVRWLEDQQPVIPAPGRLVGTVSPAPVSSRIINPGQPESGCEEAPRR